MIGKDIYTSTVKGRTKEIAYRRDDRMSASVCREDLTLVKEQGLTIKGRAEIIEDRDVAAKVCRGYVDKYWSQFTPAEQEGYFKTLYTKDRVAIKIVPVKINQLGRRQNGETPAGTRGKTAAVIARTSGSEFELAWNWRLRPPPASHSTFPPLEKARSPAAVRTTTPIERSWLASSRAVAISATVWPVRRSASPAGAGEHAGDRRQRVNSPPEPPLSPPRCLGSEARSRATLVRRPSWRRRSFAERNGVARCHDRDGPGPFWGRLVSEWHIECFRRGRRRSSRKHEYRALGWQMYRRLLRPDPDVRKARSVL